MLFFQGPWFLKMENILKKQIQKIFRQFRKFLSVTNMNRLTAEEIIYVEI